MEDLGAVGSEYSTCTGSVFEDMISYAHFDNVPIMDSISHC